MLILSGGAVANIAINYLLIPVLGIEGAAIATLAGYAISDVVGVIVLQKMKLMKIQPRFILATGMMVIFILIWRRLNQLSRTKEAYGRYRNVFLEDYSELEMEIAELDTLIEDLSAYMQSTGRKYADHAATLRSWSARKKRQQKPGAGIPDYTYNKEESL